MGRARVVHGSPNPMVGPADKVYACAVLVHLELGRCDLRENVLEILRPKDL